MTDGLKEKHRKAIIDILSANERVERVVLFGSRAMGTFTPTSDVDIVLYGAELTPTDRSKLAAAIDELPMPQQVDLLLHKSIKKRELLDHIEKHGVEWWRRSRAMGGGGNLPTWEMLLQSTLLGRSQRVLTRFTYLCNKSRQQIGLSMRLTTEHSKVQELVFGMAIPSLRVLPHALKTERLHMSIFLMMERSAMAQRNSLCFRVSRAFQMIFSFIISLVIRNSEILQ